MNNCRNKTFKFLFLSFLALIIISFIVLFPSFNLAFQDDDWRGVVLPKTDYANGKLFTSYGIQLWFCGFLYNLFDSNFHYYYILSFVLRNLVAFSILIFTYQVTKNHFASLMGAVLAVVGFSGLQTTYETASTNVYIAILGYMIFLYAFFKSKDRFSLRNLMLMGGSLSFATFVSPVRTYPIFAWMFIVDSVDLMRSYSKERMRVYLIRQLIIVVIFLVLYKIGLFSWYSIETSPENKINDFGKFLSEGTKFLAELNLNIFSNFLKGLGNIIFPSILDKTGLFSLSLGILYFISLIYSFYFVIKRRTEKVYISFAFFLWPFILYSCYFVVLLGSYADISKDTVVIESFRRYLYPPFIGFTIFMAILLSLYKKRLSNIILLISLITFFIHSLTTYFFLNDLSEQRDGAYMTKIWRQLKQLVPEVSLSSEKTNVFYFETDGSARAIYTVNDGFIGHAIALYKIDNQTSKFNSAEIISFGKLLAPPIMNIEELVSYIRKSSYDNSESEIWNRIFALKIEGDKVIDIKEDVKKRVEVLLK